MSQGIVRTVFVVHECLEALADVIFSIKVFIAGMAAGRGRSCRLLPVNLQENIRQCDLSLSLNEGLDPADRLSPEADTQTPKLLGVD